MTHPPPRWREGDVVVLSCHAEQLGRRVGPRTDHNTCRGAHLFRIDRTVPPPERGGPSDRWSYEVTDENYQTFAFYARDDWAGLDYHARRAEESEATDFALLRVTAGEDDSGGHPP